MADGHDQGPAAHPEKFARRSRMNHEVMLAFIFAVVWLSAVFIIFHLLRCLARPLQLDRKVPALRSLLNLSRKTRSILIRKVPALPSAGHAILAVVYLAINALVTFTHLDNENMSFHSNLASRTGWVAVANTVLVVFLALKNTPFAFLAARSYERLNILHQVAGYTTVTFVIAHASTYSSFFVGEGRPERLTQREEIFGMIAGFAFLVLGLSGAIVRNWWYEVFYCLHISSWMVAIVMVGLHQPDVGKKIMFATCVAASIWVLDRLMRTARLAIYCANNSVKVMPLSHGGTRVTLAKPPLGAVAGKHCFLWIPAIRRWEMHPFTIAAMQPLEFVVASYDGFTSELHDYARKHQGVPLKASVEGSYGAVPDVAGFDKVVMVAGGSGASFTFGMAQLMLERIGDSTEKRIVFVWVVKHRTYLDWFLRHLATLSSDERVSVRLFVTRDSPERHEGMEAAEEHVASTSYSTSHYGRWSRVDSLCADSEKSLPLDAEKPPSMDETRTRCEEPITHGRPDFSALIQAEMESLSRDQRVLVLGCGPDGLMVQVRNATAAACADTEGPSVELHCEQFRW